MLEEFAKGLAKGAGLFAAALLLPWLASCIPQWREPVTDFVFHLAPPDKAVLSICLALYLLGFLCFVVACFFEGIRYRKSLLFGKVAEKIGLVDSSSWQQLVENERHKSLIWWWKSKK